MHLLEVIMENLENFLNSPKFDIKILAKSIGNVFIKLELVHVNLFAEYKDQVCSLSDKFLDEDFDIFTNEEIIKIKNVFGAFKCL